MVRKGGFEPPRPCGRQPLKRSRSEARRIFVGFSGPSCSPRRLQTPPEPARRRIRCTPVAHGRCGLGVLLCWRGYRPAFGFWATLVGAEAEIEIPVIDICVDYRYYYSPWTTGHSPGGRAVPPALPRSSSAGVSTSAPSSSKAAAISGSSSSSIRYSEDMDLDVGDVDTAAPPRQGPRGPGVAAVQPDPRGERDPRSST